MFWRRISICLLSLLTLAIPIEHKYDKPFRFFSLSLIPPDVSLPSFFEKKIYFYPSDLIAIALLCIALFALRIPAARFFSKRGAALLWIVFFCTLLSIAISPLVHYPILYIRLLQLATPFLLFCFLANGVEEEDKTRWTSILLQCLLCAAAIQACLAIAQYAIQGPLGLRLLSEPNAFATFGTTSGRRWLFGLTKTQGICDIIRPSGTFPHANVLGGFLSVSILATYSFFLAAQKRVLWSGLIGLLFFAMCLTYSRSALFSWMLGTAVWLALHIKRNGLRQTLADPVIRLLALSLCLAAAFSYLVLGEQLKDRGGIVNYNNLAKGSDAGRIAYQNIAIAMIQDRPWFGAGFHQISIRGLDYLPKDSPDTAAVGAHNIYLYLAAETGLISLAAFLSFIGMLLWSAWRTPLSSIGISLAAIFCAFLFIGMCDFYPLLFQQGKLPFFLASGLLAAHLRFRKPLALKAAQ